MFMTALYYWQAIQYKVSVCEWRAPEIFPCDTCFIATYLSQWNNGLLNYRTAVLWKIRQILKNNKSEYQFTNQMYDSVLYQALNDSSICIFNLYVLVCVLFSFFKIFFSLYVLPGLQLISFRVIRVNELNLGFGIRITYY